MTPTVTALGDAKPTAAETGIADLMVQKAIEGPMPAEARCPAVTPSGFVTSATSAASDYVYRPAQMVGQVPDGVVHLARLVARGNAICKRYSAGSMPTATICWAAGNSPSCRNLSSAGVPAGRTVQLARLDLDDVTMTTGCHRRKWCECFAAGLEVSGLWSDRETKFADGRTALIVGQIVTSRRALRVRPIPHGHRATTTAIHHSTPFDLSLAPGPV
jgi:hypothetical protein